MRTARVIYHQEPEGWWASSADVPGYYGIGETYEEARDEISEGLPWTAGEDLILVHIRLSDDGSESPAKGADISLEKTREFRSAPHYFSRFTSVAKQVA